MTTNTKAIESTETVIVDGIKLAMDITRLETRGNGMLADLFKWFTRHCPNRWTFDTKVKAIKAAHKKEGIKVSPALSNLFSRMRKAYDLGLVVSEFETQNAMINATKKRDAEINDEIDDEINGVDDDDDDDSTGGDNVGEDGNPGGTTQPEPSQPVKGLDVEPNEPDEVDATLDQLRNELKGLSSEVRASILVDLKETLKKVHAAINTSRAIGSAV